MKIIGLTGSIGMGKSLVAAMLRQKAVPVFDSDACVHELIARNRHVKLSIVTHFPSTWDSRTQSINRQILGNLIFHNPQYRKILEDILHPHVFAAQKVFILKGRRMGLKQIALDIPLLFETGGATKCDTIIVTSAPSFIQKQRVMKRRGMTHEKFQKILEQQLPDHHKRRAADFVVKTGLGRAKTWRDLQVILHQIIKTPHQILRKTCHARNRT